MSENGSVALSPRQHKALRALLSENTVAKAAVASGVGESTLYKWLADAPFRAALAQAEGEAVAAAARKLVSMAELALDTVATLMADPRAPAAVRLRGAEVALANLVKFRELANFETRLTELEKEIRGETHA